MARGYVSPSFDWHRLPTMDDPADLMFRIKAGSEEARTQLITAYIRFAGSIAANYASKWKNKKEDILCIAFLTLIEAIDLAIKNDVQPENMSKYLHVSIKGRIQTFISSDFTVKVPSGSDWYSKELKENGTDIILNKSVPIQFLDQLDLKLGCARYNHGITTTKDQDQVSVNDMIAHRVFSDRERLLINLTLEGYTYEEVGDALHVSSTRIGQLVKAATRKMAWVVTGEW